MGLRVLGAQVHTCKFARVRWRPVLGVVNRGGRYVSICSFVRCHYTCGSRLCQIARQLLLITFIFLQIPTNNCFCTPQPSGFKLRRGKLNLPHTVFSRLSLKTSRSRECFSGRKNNTREAWSKKYGVTNFPIFRSKSLHFLLQAHMISWPLANLLVMEHPRLWDICRGTHVDVFVSAVARVRYPVVQVLYKCVYRRC